MRVFWWAALGWYTFAIRYGRFRAGLRSWLASARTAAVLADRASLTAAGWTWDKWQGRMTPPQATNPGGGG